MFPALLLTSFYIVREAEDHIAPLNNPRSFSYVYIYFFNSLYKIMLLSLISVNTTKMLRRTGYKHKYLQKYQLLHQNHCLHHTGSLTGLPNVRKNNSIGYSLVLFPAIVVVETMFDESYDRQL